MKIKNFWVVVELMQVFSVKQILCSLIIQGSVLSEIKVMHAHGQGQHKERFNEGLATCSWNMRVTTIYYTLEITNSFLIKMFVQGQNKECHVFVYTSIGDVFVACFDFLVIISEIVMLNLITCRIK